MVWGGISDMLKTDLVVMQGHITADMYIREI